MTDRYDELKTAIEKHFKENGSKGWKAVIERFPDISRATFWRYAKEIVHGGPKAAPKTVEPPPSQEELMKKVAQEAAEPEIHYADQVLEMITGYPRYRAVVFELQKLIDDADELKAQSVDRHGKIRNFQMYARSIRLREKLVFSQLSALEQVANFGAIEAFTKRVLQAIEEESPEVCARLITKLKNTAKPQQSHPRRN